MWLEPQPGAKPGKTLSIAAFERALPFAYMAQDVYSRDEKCYDLLGATFGESWTDVMLNGREDGAGARNAKLHVLLGKLFGLNAAIYRLSSRFDNAHVLCFEGSAELRVPRSRAETIAIIQDWLMTNLPATLSVLNAAEAVMPFGIFSKILNPRNAPSTQYDVADLVARAAIAKYGHKGIYLTGHSLGGGLAQYAAQKHGVRAIVFNSAGIGFAPGGLSLEDAIVHLKTSGDLVNEVVTDYTKPLSRHLGSEFVIGKGGHGMPFIIKAMRDQISKRG
jgi:pimeloyl-ACP methyl ester carboxylesterase